MFIQTGQDQILENECRENAETDYKHAGGGRREEEGGGGGNHI